MFGPLRLGVGADGVGVVAGGKVGRPIPPCVSSNAGKGTGGVDGDAYLLLCKSLALCVDTLVTAGIDEGADALPLKVPDSFAGEAYLLLFKSLKLSSLTFFSGTLGAEGVGAGIALLPLTSLVFVAGALGTEGAGEANSLSPNPSTFLAGKLEAGGRGEAYLLLFKSLKFGAGTLRRGVAGGGASLISLNSPVLRVGKLGPDRPCG